MHTIVLSTSTPRDLGPISPDDRVASLSMPSIPEAAPTLALLGGRPWLTAAVIAAWVACGVIIAVVLGRRGHEVRSVGALGLVLGPFLLGIARSNLIPREADALPIELAPGSHLGGDKRALVAILGPPEDVAGALPVLQTLGAELGEVLMIRPIHFESAEDESWDEEKEDAAAVLSQAALFLADFDPRLLLVPGRGGRAIRSFLEDHELDVAIAVGGSVELTAVCREMGSWSQTVVVALPGELDRGPTPR